MPNDFLKRLQDAAGGPDTGDITVYNPEDEVEEVEISERGNNLFSATFDALKKIPAVIQSSPEFFAELPGTLARAARGEYINEEGEVEKVPLEYPDMPEITEAGSLTFKESSEAGFPDIKALMTVDDLEKARILEKAFSGKDKRWGGIFKDKYHNLMITWDGKQYYINKPGMSTQDFQSILGQIGMMLPAANWARKGKMLSRGGKAVLGYGGTEAARQAITKENMDLKEGARNVGIATATEMLLPPVISGGKRIVQGITKPASYFADKIKRLEAIPYFNLQTPPAIEKIKQIFLKQKGEFNLEKTRGQFLPYGPRKDLELEKEDLIRHSGTFGNDNRILLKDFDEVQLQQIKGEVAKIVKEFTDSDRAIVVGSENELAELIGAKIKEVASSLKKVGTDAYTAAKETGSAFVLAPSIAELSDTLIRSVDELKGGARQLERMPILKENLSYLKKAREFFSDPLARNVNYKNLDDWRRRLNIDINSTVKGSPERLALETIKREFDIGINRLITKGLIEGDVESIKALQKATRLWKNYKEFSLGQKGDPAFNVMPKILKDENVSANDVLSYIFTANKIKDKGLGLDIINRIKKQGNPELIKLLKEAALIKTFTNQRTGDITRSAIVNNFRENFIKNRQIVNKLFTKEEISKLQRFVDEVETTMPAEVWNNTSKSAYSFVNAMAERKLWPVIRKIPMGVGEFIEGGAEAVMGGSAAQQQIAPITFQKILGDISKAIPAPLFLATERTLMDDVGGYNDPKKKEEDPPWENSPFNKLLQSLTDKTKNKLQTIQ